MFDILILTLTHLEGLITLQRPWLLWKSPKLNPVASTGTLMFPFWANHIIFRSCSVALPCPLAYISAEGRRKRRDKAEEGWLLGSLLPPSAAAHFDVTPERAGFLLPRRCGDTLGLRWDLDRIVGQRKSLGLKSNLEVCACWTECWGGGLPAA